MFKFYAKAVVSIFGVFLFTGMFFQGQQVSAQAKVKKPAGKPISTDLFGVFFEDISYAADGGLYAELIQNRSFEYTPGDMDAWSSKRNNWNSFAGWTYTNKGYGYGSISLETAGPVHPNNPHYLVINVEEAGKEGVGLTNTGFDGIAVKAGSEYHFSVFVKQLSAIAIPFTVKILGSRGDTIAIANFATHSGNWEKYSVVLKASSTDDSCSIAVLAGAAGKICH